MRGTADSSAGDGRLARAEKIQLAFGVGWLEESPQPHPCLSASFEASLAFSPPSPALRETERSVAEPSDTEWFLREVLPHEKKLRVYLRARFPKLRDVDDLVQESFARMMRARVAGPVTSAKSMLFTVARNAAFDLFRHERVLSIESLDELPSSQVLEERPDAAENVSRDQEIQLVIEAAQALPARCRRVFALRKIYGLSYKEISSKLGISESTVNAQVSFGIERCRQYLVARGVTRERSP